MRISDWSSDVCSSDLKYTPRFSSTLALSWVLPVRPFDSEVAFNTDYYHTEKFGAQNGQNLPGYDLVNARLALTEIARSEEHTSELQSLMRISYAVFCLKKRNELHRVIVNIV